MVKYLEGGWASNWLVLEDFRSAFIDDGSAFFVFISGFLFYSIFYKRGFDYKKFMISKIKKVFCPYFVVATAFLLYRNHFSLKGVDDPIPPIGFAIVIDQLMAALSRQKIEIPVQYQNELIIYDSKMRSEAIKKAMEE